MSSFFSYFNEITFKIFGTDIKNVRNGPTFILKITWYPYNNEIRCKEILNICRQFSSVERVPNLQKFSNFIIQSIELRFNPKNILKKKKLN